MSEADRWRTLLNESPTVIYGLERVGGRLVATDVTANIERLFGYTPEEALDPEWWPRGLHPDDRARAFAATASLDDRDDLTQEIRFRRRDGAFVWIQDWAHVVRRVDGLAVEVVGSWNDVTARRNTEDVLQKQEARLKLALSVTRQGLFDIDLATGELIVDADYALLLEYRPGELKETLNSLLDRTHPDDQAQVRAGLHACLAGEAAEYQAELRLRTRTGKWRWVRTMARVVDYDPAGRPVRMVGTHADVTRRKETELRSRRLTQLYAALSQCSEAIVRCHDESALFQRVCRTAVTQGGLSMAWIGRLDQRTRAVVPVASYGEGQEYLDGLNVTVDAASPFGRGPTGTAIRENRPYWNMDFDTNPAMEPWRERWLPHHWAASAALPLTCEGRAVASLTLYARSADGFDEDGRKLLVEMATNIGFALDGFAREARRVEAEARLAESESRYRTLFSESHLPMLLVEPRTRRIVDANRAACAFYGWPVEALTRLKLSALEAASEETSAGGSGLDSGEHPPPIATRHRLADGRLRDVEIFCSDVRVAGRELRACSLVDVTARRSVEAALREKEQLLSDSQRIAHIGSWSLDAEGRAIWSDEMFRLFGYNPAEGLPRFDQTLQRLHPEDAERLRAMVDADGQSASENDVTIRVLLPDGTLRYLSGRGERRPGPDGRATICGTLRDITVEHRAELARAESESRYRTLVEQAPVAIYVLQAGRVVLANAACVRLFGAPSAEALLGRSPLELRHPDFHELMLRRLEQLAEPGLTVPSVEQRIVRLDGRTVDVEVTAASFHHQGQTAIHVVLQDVSARLQADAAMRIKDRAIESSLNAVAIGDFEHGLTYVNPAFLKLWDLEHPDDALGQPVTSFWQDPAQAAEVVAALHARERWSGEMHTRTVRGRELDLLVTAGLVRDAAGHLICFLANFADLTERLRAEAHVRASLHEKEALLREIHHRVKNNLQVVTSLLRLEAGRQTEAAVQDVLREMQSRVLSMALLHETLYRTDNFARIELSGYLAELARQVVRSLAPTTAGIRLTLDVAPASVEFDQAIPCGLLLNELVSNAIKHGFHEGAGGEIRVSLHPEGPDGRMALVVENDGAALPADIEERLGRSLGLQLVSDLARQLGGKLTIGPELRARFSVVFTPKAPPPPPA